jgi:hypothetical protein
MRKQEMTWKLRCLESHEWKVTNNMLQEKIQTAEDKYSEYSKAAREEKEKLTKKIDFLVAFVMRSTEETLNMERKLNEAKKVIKKKKEMKS